MIARHFGEVWESSQCNKMCDHCDRTCKFIGIAQVIESKVLDEKECMVIIRDNFRLICS